MHLKRSILKIQQFKLASISSSAKIKNEEWTRLAHHPLVHRSSGIAIHFLGIHSQSQLSIQTAREVIESLKPSVVLMGMQMQQSMRQSGTQTLPWMPLDSYQASQPINMATMEAMEAARETGSIIKFFANDANAIKSAKIHFKLVEPASTKASWIGNVIYKVLLWKKFGNGFQARLAHGDCSRLELADFLRTWALFHPTEHYKLLEAPCASIMYQTRSIIRKMVLEQKCKPDAELKSLLIVVDKAYTFGLFDLWTRCLQNEVFTGFRSSEDCRLESDVVSSPKQEQEPIRLAQSSS